MPSVARALRPVDRLEVWTIVDTALDLFSTMPDRAATELPNLLRAGLKEFSGAGLCCAAWGLSLLVRASVDGTERTVLFDAGPEAYAFERNATRLGLDLSGVGAVVLSHGHFDHASGLPAALGMVRAAAGRPVPVHVNAGMFGTRGDRREDGTVLPLADIPSVDALGAAGGAVVEADDGRTLLDDTFFLSGEIPRVTAYERGLPNQVRRGPDGGWVPDPLVRDERFLAVHVRDHGVVVFSACSHAGIVNVLREAARLFDPVPIHAAMGGLHLSGRLHEPKIDDTVRDLAEFRLRRLVPSHCTGWRATHALVRAFGDAVVPGAVGQSHVFGPDR